MIDFIFGCKPSHFLSSRIEVRGEIIWAYPQQLLNHQKKLYWWLIESSIISVGSNDLKRSKSCCRVGGLLTREAGGILFWHKGGGKRTNEVRRQNYCKKNVKKILSTGILHTFLVPIPPLDLHLSYVSQESIFVFIFSHFHCQGSEKRVVISQFVRHNFPLVYNKERVIQLKS